MSVGVDCMWLASISDVGTFSTASRYDPRRRGSRGHGYGLCCLRVSSRKPNCRRHLEQFIELSRRPGFRWLVPSDVVHLNRFYDGGNQEE
jgi:hypothetical protein